MLVLAQVLLVILLLLLVHVLDITDIDAGGRRRDRVRRATRALGTGLDVTRL